MGSRREVEVTITSAKDLKNVNWRHGPLRPYAVVWVDPNNKSSTKVDEEGDTSPFWDHTLVIPLPPSVPIEDQTLYIDIVHAGAAEDTKPLIGSAKLRLTDVLNDSQPLKRTLYLKRPSGRPQGKVDVKVSIRDPRYRAPVSYYAPPYGVPPPTSSSPYGYGGSYAPPSNPYYSAPPQPPTGYAYGGQPSYGYGYGGEKGVYAQEEKKKSSKFGGMGTGLAVGAVAGAVGGIALVEGFDALEDKIADDAADKVEDDLADDGYDGDDF